MVMRMRSKDRYVLAALAIALTASVAVTYYKTIVKQEFVVVNVGDEADPEAGG